MVTAYRPWSALALHLTYEHWSLNTPDRLSLCSVLSFDHMLCPAVCGSYGMLCRFIGVCVSEGHLHALTEVCWRVSWLFHVFIMTLIVHTVQWLQLVFCFCLFVGWFVCLSVSQQHYLQKLFICELLWKFCDYWYWRTLSCPCDYWYWRTLSCPCDYWYWRTPFMPLWLLVLEDPFPALVTTGIGGPLSCPCDYYWYWRTPFMPLLRPLRR